MKGIVHCAIGVVSLLCLAGCGGGGSDGAVVSADTLLVNTKGTTDADASADRISLSSEPKDAAGTSGSVTQEIAITKPFRRADAVVDVGVGTITPSVVAATFYEGYWTPNALLVGTAAGDVSLLNGRSLFVTISGVGSLYGAAGAAPIANPPGLAVALQGQRQNRAGTFHGAMQISVCLDSACKTQLRGMPLLIPYQVDVLRGYRAGVDEMQIVPLELPRVVSRVGEEPPVAQVVLTPPERAPFHSLTTYVDPLQWGFEPAKQPKAVLTDNGNGTVTLAVRFPPNMPPGLRQALVTLGAWSQFGENTGPGAFNVKVPYEVQPSSTGNVVFNPSALSFQIKAGEQVASRMDFTAITALTGGTVQYEGVEYLFTPEQEAAFPVEARAKLVVAGNTQMVGASVPHSVSAYGCVPWYDSATATQTQCLPVGNYAFRLRYRQTELGGVGSTLHYLPGLITIVP